VVTRGWRMTRLQGKRSRGPAGGRPAGEDPHGPARQTPKAPGNTVSQRRTFVAALPEDLQLLLMLAWEVREHSGRRSGLLVTQGISKRSLLSIIPEHSLARPAGAVSPARPSRRVPARAGAGGAGDLVRGSVHGHAGHRDRQRGAAPDARQPGAVGRGRAVGGERLHPHLRRACFGPSSTRSMPGWPCCGAPVSSWS
jgi:hypothetical protein